jgi:hypothetical protein
MGSQSAASVKLVTRHLDECVLQVLDLACVKINEAKPWRLRLTM